ncbi:MAG: M23 family metallopeptidase [Clostridia bacterium]|nr:M23 family metallopeptidase [Clostridia bacterium]
MAKGKRKNRGNGFLVAFLCLPLALILCFTIYYSSLDSADKVTLTTPGCDTLTFTELEDVEFFVSMLKNALPISTAMRDVSEESPVYITLCTGDDPTEYKLYPSLNLSGCLLVNPEGDLFVLETEVAKTLLLKSEFDYLYSSYFLPTLSVVSGENEYPVSPVECVWNYYKTDGKQYSYSPDSLATGEETYVILKGLENKLKFTPDGEVRPFEMTDISYIADNGSEYSITDISQLDLSFDTRLTVSFTAKWSGMNGAQASGEAKYKFNILYDIPAIIELPKSEFTVGDVIVLDATHINEDESITLNTSLDIGGFGFGMTEAGKGVALIPIGLKNTASGYTLEIVSGLGSKLESISVSPRPELSWSPIETTDEQYYAMLSPTVLEEFAKTLSDATATRPENDYFNYLTNTFNRPVGDRTPVYSYGQPINIGPRSGDTGERICEGLVYEVDAGTSIRSAQAGEVVFSGELAPTGNTVVVYHGYGVYSYYFHLESLNVQKGYTLTDGEIVGTAGSTGFTNGKTVLHFAMSIDGVFVDPMWFFNK